MFYDRKIEYFDYLENGDKVRNAGFVKIEVVEDFCNIQVNITGLFPTDTFTREVRIWDGTGETVLGEIELTNGRGSVQWRKLPKNRLGKEALPYEEVCGFRIYIAKNRELLCRLREASGSKRDSKLPISPADGGGRQVEGRKAEASQERAQDAKIYDNTNIIESTGAADATDMASYAGAAVSADTAAPAGKADIRNKTGFTGTTASRNMTMSAGMAEASVKADSAYAPEATVKVDSAYAPEESVKADSAYEPEASGKADSAYEPEASVKVDSAYAPEASVKVDSAYAPEESVRADSAYAPEPSCNVKRRNMAAASGMEAGSNVNNALGGVDPVGIGRASDTVGSARMEHSPGNAAIPRPADSGGTVEAPGAKEELSASRRPERKAAQSNPRMPARLYDNKWKQLTSIYPHLAPFHDERDYLSIGPVDFVVLRREYHKLVNNSFLLHGYYNYEHLILTRVEQRGEERFYVGVPGNYYEREKQVAVMYGFESFECKTEPAQTGDYGYYMIRVEI